MSTIPDSSPHLSDTVALQVYKDFAPSKKILWAGRPKLRGAYWVRMGAFCFFAILAILLNSYLLYTSQASTFWWIAIFVISCFVNLFAVLVFWGVIVLTRRNQNSYYAFDKDTLYLYNQFQDRFHYYPLAVLPDFVTHPHKDGTSTLRCSFRRGISATGKTYKTPVLYCLPNGKAVLDILRQVQEKAKLEAIKEQTTPSWLPQD